MNEIVLMSHSSDLENSETYGPAVVGTITTRYGKGRGCACRRYGGKRIIWNSPGRT
jgi:hypothetical protein